MWGIQPHVFTVQPRAYLRSRRNRIDRAVEKKLRKGERGEGEVKTDYLHDEHSLV
jgi:hypothetical protein